MYPMNDDFQAMAEELSGLFSVSELLTFINLVMRVEQAGFSIVIKRAA